MHALGAVARICVHDSPTETFFAIKGVAAQKAYRTSPDGLFAVGDTWMRQLRQGEGGGVWTDY